MAEIRMVNRICLVHPDALNKNIEAKNNATPQPRPIAKIAPSSDKGLASGHNPTAINASSQKAGTSHEARDTGDINSSTDTKSDDTDSSVSSEVIQQIIRTRIGSTTNQSPTDMGGPSGVVDPGAPSTIAIPETENATGTPPTDSDTSQESLDTGDTMVFTVPINDVSSSSVNSADIKELIRSRIGPSQRSTPKRVSFGTATTSTNRAPRARTPAAGVQRGVPREQIIREAYIIFDLPSGYCRETLSVTVL